MPAWDQTVRAGLAAGSTEPGQIQETAAARISAQITGRWKSNTASVCARRSRLPSGPGPGHTAELPGTSARRQGPGDDHRPRPVCLPACCRQAQAGRKAELEKALLSKAQQTALARIKRYTDFNDLATQSRLGRAGVERQIRATVNKAVAEVKQK